MDTSLSTTAMLRRSGLRAPVLRAAALLMSFLIALATSPLGGAGTAEAQPGKPGTTEVTAAGSLVVSWAADGSVAVPLNGQVLRDSVYPYATPSGKPAQVRYFLDDPTMLDAPFSVQANRPYPLVGHSGADMQSWSSTSVADGTHTLTVAYVYRNGRTVIEHATFEVANVVSSPEPEPEPSPEPEPVLDLGGGLTWSGTELATWQTRAAVGPYRKAGDVSANSPGDWDRIAANAKSLMSNPSAERWAGPSGTGCVQANDESPPRDVALVRDAAFHALVAGNTTMRTAAAKELLAQSRVAGVQFANSKRWCAGIVYDRSPSFGIAAWMTKLLLAYDYLGPDAFTSAQHTELRAWFWHAAKWLQVDADRKLDDNFVDRYNGDYTLTKTRADNPGWGRVGFLGSQQTGAIARYYNNRRATSMFYAGLVGVQQGDTTLQASSKRFVKEWLTYSVYPDGWTGEFERWRDDLPDLGWAYSTYNVAFAGMTADLFARQGDTELFTFTTPGGVHGTKGGSKSLHTALHSHARYLNGSMSRHGTDQSSRTTDAYLIDGVNGSWESVHDIAAAIGNLYYKDATLRGVYLRTGSGLSGYPSKPASQGGATAWSGVWGIYPGVLFMHGQMEAVSPYPPS